MAVEYCLQGQLKFTESVGLSNAPPAYVQICLRGALPYVMETPSTYGSLMVRPLFVLYEWNAVNELYWYPRTCPHTLEYSTGVWNTVPLHPCSTVRVQRTWLPMFLWSSPCGQVVPCRLCHVDINHLRPASLSSAVGPLYVIVNLNSRAIGSML